MNAFLLGASWPLFLIVGWYIGGVALAVDAWLRARRSATKIEIKTPAKLAAELLGDDGIYRGEIAFVGAVSAGEGVRLLRAELARLIERSRAEGHREALDELDKRQFFARGRA